MMKVEITPENVDELVEHWADLYLPGKDIEARFVAIKSQMCRDWCKNGEVRRQPHTAGRAEWEYNVADVIVARLHHRRVKPFLRKVVDGVEQFRCNKCLKWKGRDGFYKNTVPSVHGLLTTCITCHLEAGNANRDRSDIAKKIHAEKARQARARRQEQVKKAAAWKAPDRIDAKRIIELIDRRFPDKEEHHDREVCALAGVHDEVVRTIRRRAKEGGNVMLDIVDDLFSGLNWADDLSIIHEELERDRPAWGPHGEPYCSVCLRSNRTYMARGMCSTCYKRRDDPNYRPMTDNPWAMRYSHCVDCGTRDKKHVANGRCGKCDGRWRRRNGR